MYKYPATQYASDLGFDLSRSFKVKFDCATGLPPYMTSCYCLRFYICI